MMLQHCFAIHCDLSLEPNLSNLHIKIERDVYVQLIHTESKRVSRVHVEIVPPVRTGFCGGLEDTMIIWLRKSRK